MKKNLSRMLALICAILILGSAAAQAAEVRLIQGTTAEMLSPDYWQAEDELLLTEDQIAEINAANSPRLTYHDAAGEECLLYLADLSDTISGDVLRQILAEYALPEKDAVYYMNGEALSWGFWALLDANRNIEAIPEEVPVRYAVCVTRQTSYSFPSDAWITSTPEDLYYDELTLSEVMPGDCVAVLWESADGAWYLADFGPYVGWIRKEYLALCHDRAEWQAYADCEDFLVVLENNLQLEYAADGSSVSEAVLPMGMKVHLAEEVPERVHGRIPVGCYVVELPVRGEDGFLTTDYALIPTQKAVSEGYPAFTARAFLQQYFRFLGQTYGWCGNFHANDCSGTIRQVLRCFGLETPRNSTKIISMSGLKKTDISAYTLDERVEFFRTLPVGSLCAFPGHIMVYLGMVEDVPYVISAVGSFAEESGAEVTQFNAVLINPMTVTRRSGLSWLESVTMCLEFEAEAEVSEEEPT